MGGAIYVILDVVFIAEEESYISDDGQGSKGSQGAQHGRQGSVDDLGRSTHRISFHSFFFVKATNGW